ncbi:FkbM family methyltransferase [Parvibaculum sp.]|uniref:FkbM family methyltransferase n=1 Tax=Parvibaculum sp. TaxID=2024848 RepID=UPI00272AC15B|nr:FkbM family methyltransferase [Parvibaculum sp.]
MRRSIVSSRMNKSSDAMRRFWNFPNTFTKIDLHRTISLFPHARGEIFQDIFAALVLDEKDSGFFVEFGATDGVNGSNTWLFENRFGWDGVLAEPARVWHAQLARNRCCRISHACVWMESGQTLQFHEVADAGFSTLQDYAGRDRHARRRRAAIRYPVETVSLDDLLKRSDAPRKIDFMSIDTEGSERDILSVFPFGDWEISIMTVEHNFRPDRTAMHDILSANGFVRVLPELSQFDDWYVAEALAARVATVFPDGAEQTST